MGGAQRAEFSRWAGAKHQDRHDEGRARRHVVLGGRHRGAPDLPRRRRQFLLVGDMQTGAPLSARRLYMRRTREEQTRPGLMPPSVWRTHSANFIFTEFSEVRLTRPLRA